MKKFNKIKLRMILSAAGIADLRVIMRDAPNFSNWKEPTTDELQHEYNIEYKHHAQYTYGPIWPEFEDFLEAANKGEVIDVTNEFDEETGNRSRTETIDALVGLVSQYRSWPEFRNYDTLAGIINCFVNNDPICMPIILEVDGDREIFSGNTRMDIAFMMGVKPKALLIKVETK